MQGGSKKERRKQWATKTRTGCMTCKRRRIKCDEGKPTCKRCYIRDIECEGYQDLSYQPPKLSFESNAAWQVANTLVSPRPDCQRGVSAAAIPHCNDQTILGDDSNRCYISRGTTNSSSDLTWDETPAGEHEPSVESPQYGSISDISTSDSAMTTYIAHPVASPLWPYNNPVEQKALQDYLQIMLPMGRSDVGFRYWTVTVPSFSYIYEPVRHAQTAMSIVWNSLRRGDDEEAFKTWDIVATKWANKAIRGLMEDEARNTPAEVLIVVSTLFWLLDLCAGRLVSSLDHLMAGHNMATSLTTDVTKPSDPMIPLYVKDFIGMLTPQVHPEVVRLSAEEREKNFHFRRRYAKAIMGDAVDRLRSVALRIESSTSEKKSLALGIVKKQLSETAVIVQSWPSQNAVTADEDFAEHKLTQEAIGRHSPFISVINDLEKFFVDDDESHLLKFDEDFRPSVDHFMWLATHKDRKLRWHVWKLWSVPRSTIEVPQRSFG